MGAVRRLALAVMLFYALPAEADPVDRWRPMVAEAAARFGLPEDWILRVMRAESGGQTMLAGRPITSRAGAMGLMQLMPATWVALRATLDLGPDPYAPRDNILAGTAYLRRLHDRFGYPGLFAAYNAGPARYAEHLATGRPLPAETRTYLARVAGMRLSVRAIRQCPVQGLFVALTTSPAAPREGGTSGPNRMLFVPLSGVKSAP